MFEDVRSAVADTPIVVGQGSLDVTFSCGVPLYIPSEDGRDRTALLAEADRALYEAKESGRNRTFFASLIAAVCQVVSNAVDFQQSRPGPG